MCLFIEFDGIVIVELNFDGCLLFVVWLVGVYFGCLWWGCLFEVFSFLIGLGFDVLIIDN